MTGPEELKELSNRDPTYGWLMVTVVFMLSGLAFGILGSISVFLKPLSSEFGWGRGQTSLGYSAIAFSSALFGVFWGYVADRYGTRWFGVVGSSVMALSLFLLSTQTNIVEFYAFYFLFGALGHALLTTPLFANVGYWFRQNPGLAMGVALSGSAVGQGLIPYLAGIAITEVGWQSAYLMLAAGYLVIALPISFLIRESPLRNQVRIAGADDSFDFPVSKQEVLIWIGIAVLFCCNCMAVPIVHLVPLLTDSGHSLEFGTRVLLVLMIFGAMGRILGGKLADTIGPLETYILMSVGQTISVFWFPQFNQTVGLYLLAAFFGVTYSGVMASSIICVRMMVPANFAGRAIGITGLFGWAGMGLGGFAGGVLFDFNNNYLLSYAFASLMGSVNVAILVLFYLRLNSKNKARTARA